MSHQNATLLGCCSDTHGSLLPQWSDCAIAAVLHAGDFYDAPTLLDDDDEDPTVRQWLAAAGIPINAVRGNHDHRDPLGFFSMARDLTGRLRRLAPGLWVAGIGFAHRLYFDLPSESDLQPQCDALARQAGRELTPEDKLILLTHYPPKLPELPCGDVPSSWTFTSIADLIDELQPVSVVQGHVHDWFAREWRRESGTLIVSPGPTGRILAISEDGRASLVTRE